MRPRLGVILALLASATPAAADDWSLHVVAVARAGWTDNLQNDEAAEAEAEEYVQLTPGLLFTWSRPRSVNELSVSLENNVYVHHDEGSWYTWHGGWRGAFETSPLSQLSGAVTASGGTMNTFTTELPAANGTLQLIPSTASTFLTLDAQQAFSIQVSRPLRLSQNGLATVYQSEPRDSTMGTTTRGYRVGGGVGGDRAWQYNAIGVNAQLTYDGLGGDLTQLTGQGTVSWRRDLGLHWTTLVDAGVVTLIPVGADYDTAIEPTVGAQISYFPAWGSAGFSVRRTVTPNVYIAANTVNDAATLNAALPLWRGPTDPNGQPRITVEGSVGWAFTSVIDATTGEKQGGYQLGLADAGLTYAIKPQVNVGVRYQWVHQRAGSDALPLVTDYDRNTILVTFYGRWPDRLAAEVPMRSSLRVDRSDDTSGQTEVVPEGTRPR